MTLATRPAPQEIRRARADNPKMRERDLALSLGISEAELVAAHCGHGVRRIAADANALISGLGAVGEVMALTRNESAVHEKIGPYEKPVTGEGAALVLGAEIDLRIFPAVWKHGFAVEKPGEDGPRRSLQFFDAAGDAVHKVHLRPASDLDAYRQLVERLAVADQSPHLAVTPRPAPAAPSGDADPQALRADWAALRDVHDFHAMLRRHGVGRRQAFAMVGEDFVWRLQPGCVADLFAQVVQAGMPIMCFVGSRGCIQIHSGPIVNVKEMGPWINVMDPSFHLHLRADHVSEAYLVRKPTKDGNITSVELYRADGEMIIQFFGLRHEGEAERADWRSLAEGLPRLGAG